MDKKLSEKTSHVKAKELFVIWSAIILIVVSLLFPPYGYTKFTVTYIYYNLLLDPRVEQNTVPWTYVKLKFIFSAPPRFDPNLDRIYKDDARASRFVEIENMQVAWLIVAIQTSVIIIVAIGVLLTMRIRKGHIDS